MKENSKMDTTYTTIGINCVLMNTLRPTKVSDYQLQGALIFQVKRSTTGYHVTSVQIMQVSSLSSVYTLTVSTV